MKWLSGHARIDYLSLFRILQRAGRCSSTADYLPFFLHDIYFHGLQGLAAAGLSTDCAGRPGRIAAQGAQLRNRSVFVGSSPARSS